MFTVKECTDSETADKLCEKFGYKTRGAERFFVLEEGAPIGIGVLALRGARVVVEGVFGELGDSYRDVLNRSLLHVCRCMNPITVRVESTDAYWKKFGFKEADGGMEIVNTDLNFHC